MRILIINQYYLLTIIRYGVNLKQYLSDIQGFLHPSDVARCPASLLAARDSHVVMSAQSCFLPVPKVVTCSGELFYTFRVLKATSMYRFITTSHIQDTLLF